MTESHLTPEQKAELAELCAKATPGEWDQNTLAGRPNSEVFSGNILICDCRVTNIEMSFEEIEANCALIAAAKNAVPALLAENKAQAQRIAELEGEKDVLEHIRDFLADRGVWGCVECEAPTEVEAIEVLLDSYEEARKEQVAELEQENKELRTELYCQIQDAKGFLFHRDKKVAELEKEVARLRAGLAVLYSHEMPEEPGVWGIKCVEDHNAIIEEILGTKPEQANG